MIDEPVTKQDRENATYLFQRAKQLTPDKADLDVMFLLLCVALAELRELGHV
jgi:hypothetical protein